MLKLTPRLLQAENWTPADEAVVGDHFARLQRLLAEGVLILAGKTDGLDTNTFGLVIFEAADEPTAQALMASDPAVAGGIMTATLYPYSVALMRK